jgi:hypothetical protein
LNSHKVPLACYKLVGIVLAPTPVDVLIAAAVVLCSLHLSAACPSVLLRSLRKRTIAVVLYSLHEILDRDVVCFWVVEECKTWGIVAKRRYYKSVIFPVRLMPRWNVMPRKKVVHDSGQTTVELLPRCLRFLPCACPTIQELTWIFAGHNNMHLHLACFPTTFRVKWSTVSVLEAKTFLELTSHNPSLSSKNQCKQPGRKTNN